MTGVAGVGGMVVALYVLARDAPARQMRGSLVLFLFGGSVVSMISLRRLRHDGRVAVARGLAFAFPVALGVIAGQALFTPRWEGWYRPFCLSLLMALAGLSLARTLDMNYPTPDLNLSPKVSDEIRKTTCYMCACRCGIDVHMKAQEDGKLKVAYIEGNRDHPVNQGVLCAKGSAGIMQVNAPSRLRAPLKRVGPARIGQSSRKSPGTRRWKWPPAWLAPIRAEAPEKLAFFTGRDQSQSFTSLWAQGFGTPNYAAHGGFCSVNMAAAGIYTMGGAFWEFGQPDWDHTRMFVLFGVAEDHDSNPIKMGIGKIKARGAKMVGVNPIRTGYNAVADDWYGITPGTDGLLILSLIHLLFTAGKLDLDYLARFTNASCLVNEDPKIAAERPSAARRGRPAAGHRPAHRRVGAVERQKASSRTCAPPTGTRASRTVPCFTTWPKSTSIQIYAPENVAERTGISAPRIRTLAAQIARTAFDEAIELPRAWTDFRGKKHDTMIGRPVSFHAMRGISAHSNGFQTCRALHVLQIIIGAVETPGGMRFKPPYPKPATAHPKPHCKVTPGAALDGPHLGYPHGPEDLCLKRRRHRPRVSTRRSPGKTRCRRTA